MMVRPAALVLGLALGLALLGGPALAAAPLAAQGCLGCHGPGGIGSPPIPPLAGRLAAETVAAMAAFRSGERQGTIMPRIARGYTEAEIAEVAAYFSALPAGASR